MPSPSAVMGRGYSSPPRVAWPAVGERNRLDGRRYVVRTFGCQMNEHDSERIAGLLEADGLVAAGDLADADVVVLNTCCIRENADNKLYGNLGHLKTWKAQREGRQIVVSGCLAQKDRDTVRQRAAHVDVVMGTHNVHRAAELLATARHRGPITEIFDEAVIDDHALFPSALPAVRDTSFNAWVTIQIGCDNHCAFCIVPAVRGVEISRPFEEIVAEVGELAAAGVTEITLLGQNVNSYGRDLQLAARRGGDATARLRPLFADLLRATGAVEGIRRVRFTSPHPKDMRPETFAAMAETPAVCPQLHYPLQAGSDRVLAAMHRGYTAERYLDRLGRSPPDRPRSRRVHGHHRRLPRRDRRRLRTHARGGGGGPLRRRLHVHLLAASRHRGSVDERPLRRSGGRRRALRPSAHRHRTQCPRREPGADRADRGGRWSSARARRTRPSSPPARPSTGWCTSRPPVSLRPGTYAAVEITGAAPHHLTGRFAEVLAEPAHRVRIPVAAL